jgi:hypothetical protein
MERIDYMNYKSGDAVQIQIWEEMDCGCILDQWHSGRFMSFILHPDGYRYNIELDNGFIARGIKPDNVRKK